MNVNPGGKQESDVRWMVGWKSVSRWNFSLGVPKGVWHILEERGVNTHLMKADEMCAVLNGGERTYSVYVAKIPL